MGNGCNINVKECDMTPSYLKGWYDASVRYLCRCVALLNADVALLFHLASMNRYLQVDCNDNSVKSDILRFLNSCDVSELISGTSNRNLDNEFLVGPNASSRIQLRLTVNDDNNYSFNDKECDDYCQDWANLIVEGDRTDPMFIKSVIENFKLTTVQSMNTFKRLVTDAEANHYALYRAFLYLKNSKQKETLLANAKIQDGIVSSKGALDVINILEQLI